MHRTDAIQLRTLKKRFAMKNSSFYGTLVWIIFCLYERSKEMPPSLDGICSIPQKYRSVLSKTIENTGTKADFSAAVPLRIKANVL